MIGVRLSVFDTVPYRRGPDGTGEPDPGDTSGFGFGVLGDDGMDAALDDARGVIRMLTGLGVRAVCVTGGTPYYNPHVQRPALFPPVDGYEPPEDPLRGRGTADRCDGAAQGGFSRSRVRRLRLQLPSGVAAATSPSMPSVEGLTDFVGLGTDRALVSGAARRRARRARRCAASSSAARSAIARPGREWAWSPGCYPLDPHYAATPGSARASSPCAPRERGAGGAPRSSPMRIADAKVIICSPGRNFVTLKLVTEDGVSGLGDATLNGRELSVAAYLSEHLVPLLIGRDAGGSKTPGSTSTRAPTGVGGR